MDLRLDFSLPEFQRIVWASPSAQAVWESRIHAVSNAWQYIERIAVVWGKKPAALQMCSSDELPQMTEWAVQKDLVCLPLNKVARSTGYSNASTSLVEGQSWDYRIIITNPVLARLFVQFWKEGDDERIGAALGFPRCCRQFFQKYWVEEGWRDLTFPMVNSDDRHINVSGPAECNILLRWLGVRAVSHLPCSFSCETTKEVGEELVKIGLRHGYVREMTWLSEMLNWPIRWSSLHGAAIITTPVFKLIVDSTAVRKTLTIDRDGPIYPTEGARGTEFPFKTIHTLSVRRANDYSDNGFSSLEAQEKAHKVVLQAVQRVTEKVQSGGQQKVIDLGCGNGKLLEEILHVAPWLSPCGVEQEEGRFQRAARRLVGHSPDLRHCRISDGSFWVPPYRLALLSVNRIREMVEADARELLVRLRDNCEKIIFYSYDTNEWPGIKVPNTAHCFQMDEHFADDSTCAMLMTPRRDNDQDPVQR